ncbi:hypothetical protein K5M76_06445 [Shewanella xiamenensis]|uniref:hypothetical protein n=1 Tax=Shewanella TaxID=22 RepID=UPI0002E9F83A|nr:MULTISPECIES: hypothetical protein [Shewanella]MCH7423959.1 hypothetical protein [Shewanella sp. MM_2022_3]MCT8858315.1 hypothetical protein [Shewanella xiamenensis]MCT8866510.1 hypothetical protein [Shewanella xiamenensis]MDI5875774.1 hypothetical protein [Shewanella xiamenensis]PWH04743.1 hypothetical protein DIY08_00385 [Shewanella xiamenensis]
MTFVTAVSHQWLKAQLAYRLQLSLAACENIHDLCCGGTSLASVTNIMSAIIFIEGQPQWLVLDKTMNEQKLPDNIVLHCFFECCRVLFIRELSHQSLSQAEQLIFTLAEVWRSKYIKTQEVDSVSESICSMIERLSKQLMMHRLQLRTNTRNMGGL